MLKWFKKKTPPASPLTEQTHSPAMFAEAKKNPNGWVYAIDSSYDPKGEVPPHAIKGCWKVNANGEIEGEFIPNPNFRPKSS